MMEQLPVELVHFICTHMTQSALGNFRQASKYYAEVGAKCMFENLHLMILFKSYENLTNIASRPSLSKWVKKITYEATTLELLEHDEWKEQLPTAPMAPPMPEHPGYPLTPRDKRHYGREMKLWDQEYGPGSQFTEKQLKNGWLSYREVMELTDEIEIYYKDFATMNAVFGAFPQLQAIEFHTNKEASETMKAAFASTLIAPGPATEDDRELASALSLRYLTPLLLALIHTGVKLTSFKADAISWHAFYSPLDIYHYATRTQNGPTVEFPWQLDPADLPAAFGNIQQLHLVFESEFGPDMSIKSEQEALSRVLGATKLLRDLRLEVNEPFYSSNFPPDQVYLHRVCANAHWPHLESLEFSSVRTTEDYLVDLMKRHSGTLKTLKLRSMYLCQGQWASAFQRMRAVLKLTEVALHDVFINADDPDEEEDDAVIEDKEDDLYLDMQLPTGILGFERPLGARLETYFLGENYRCPLRTKEQKEKLRLERERARAKIDIKRESPHIVEMKCLEAGTMQEDDGLLSC